MRMCMCIHVHAHVHVHAHARVTCTCACTCACTCDMCMHMCMCMHDVCQRRTRLHATLSQTCSKPRHLAFRMGLHVPTHANVRHNAWLTCARTRTPLRKPKQRSVQQLETRPNDGRERHRRYTCYMLTSKHVPHPKPQRDPRHSPASSASFSASL